MIQEHDHEYRMGIGTDVHAFVEGKRLMLGGVYVPYPFGLKGHSDGDVAIHAVIDGILGAAGMGDIGTHFPDKDMKYKDADSKGLLVDIREKLAEKHWEIVNIDLTIHAELPRLEPFKAQIKQCISSLLVMDFAAMNVKAKTSEGLGYVGRGEGIAATAAVLIRRKYRRML